MKYCNHCDKTFADGYTKCPYCNRKLGQSYKAICPHCHKEMKSLSKPYCPHCGGAITIPGMKAENPAERIKASRPGFFYVLTLIFLAIQILVLFVPLYFFTDQYTGAITTKLTGLDTILFFFTGHCQFFTDLGGGGNLKRCILFMALLIMINLVFAAFLAIFDFVGACKGRRGRVSRRASNIVVWSTLSLLAVIGTFAFGIYLTIFFRESGHTLGSFANNFPLIIWLGLTIILWCVMLVVRATKITKRRNRIY